MFDYSPINTYPCTPPGVATNIKKKVKRSTRGLDVDLCEFQTTAMAMSWGREGI